MPVEVDPGYTPHCGNSRAQCCNFAAAEAYGGTQEVALDPSAPLAGSLTASAPTMIACFFFQSQPAREGSGTPVYKYLLLPQLSGGVWRPR